VLQAQAIPAFRYSVANNTALLLSCQLRIGEGAFEPLMIEPGGEWADPAPTRATVAQISCQLPVKQVVFPVLPGKRYRFLRQKPNALIKLRKVQSS
jgi:hypothetical protein